MAPCLPVSFKVPCQQMRSCTCLLCQWFYRPLPRSNVSHCNFLPLHVGKPLFMDGSIIPRATGVQFFRACFCLLCPLTLNCMKPVAFIEWGLVVEESTFCPHSSMHISVKSCNLKCWISIVDSLVYKTAGKVGDYSTAFCLFTQGLETHQKTRCC